MIHGLLGQMIIFDVLKGAEYLISTACPLILEAGGAGWTLAGATRRILVWKYLQ
jgi:hypothetical protein